MECPFTAYPFMACPFAECPFKECPFKECPFKECPFAECPLTRARSAGRSARRSSAGVPNSSVHRSSSSVRAGELLLGSSGAQARRHHFVQASDDPPDDGEREGVRLVREAAREHLLEGRRCLAQVQQARGSGGGRIDDHQAGALRAADDVLDELLEDGAHAVLELAVGGSVCLAGSFDRAGRDQVEARQEALLLVRELFVEGPARDARERDDRLDARLWVAILGDRLDHRPMDAGPLMLDDVVARESVRTGGQALVEGRYPWGWGRYPWGCPPWGCYPWGCYPWGCYPWRGDPS